MSRYAAAHAATQGPGDARPTALQIVRDAGMEGKLAGRVAVVTGASSGLGVETVRALAATGLRFFLPGRSPDKLKAALGDAFDPAVMEIVPAELGSFASVRAAAAAILAKTDVVHLFVANAGIMAVPDLQKSEDGYELQFATNHLSHFLLFQLLKPALLAASTPELHSRVVVVSSDLHRSHPLVPGTYGCEDGYHPAAAYGRSKVANVYMANEIERRYGARGLHATAIHPGVIPTGLGRYLTDEQIRWILQSEPMVRFGKNPEQGAATTVWAAVSSEWEGRGGRYLSHCADAPALQGSLEDDISGSCHAAHTYNPGYEASLWKDSLAMVAMEDDQVEA
ncbi:putative short-chain dehydrogenase/reductase [Thozetella sp. PMI_491]|nr:putative short-chain dehydrogenase/reductase [Thozetella sp. PMI_491]